MVRLLDLLRRQGPHAEVFTALVHACRFAGLLDASAAAHDQSQRLDAGVDTGVMHTYFLQRRYPEAIVASGTRKGYVWGLSMAEVAQAAADPEALYYSGRFLAHLDDRDAALALLRKSVDGGYMCSEALDTDPWLEAMRSQGQLQDLRRVAGQKSATARRLFDDANGTALLGMR